MKKHTNPIMKTFKRIRLNFLLIALLASGYPLESFAATYNLYFNNTEQGDNSTATPNVYVKDGKKAEAGAEEDETADDTDTAVPAKTAPKPVAAPETTNPDTYPAITPNTSVSTVRHYPYEDQPRFRRFRFFGGAGNLAGSYQIEGTPFNNDPHSSLPFWEQKTTGILPKTGYGVGFSVGFIPSLAMTLTVGTVSALEFEVSPLGRGQHFFEPVLMTGFSAAEFGQNNALVPHLGGRLILNVSDPIGIHATARKSLTSGNSNLEYTQFEAGLIFSI